MLMTLEAGGFITLDPPPPKPPATSGAVPKIEGPVFHSVKAGDVISADHSGDDGHSQLQHSRWVSTHLAPMTEAEMAAELSEIADTASETPERIQVNSATGWRTTIVGGTFGRKSCPFTGCLMQTQNEVTSEQPAKSRGSTPEAATVETEKPRFRIRSAGAVDSAGSHRCT
jgi:hypothetical protein